MNKPEWLRRGALAKVQHWDELVENVALSDRRVVVLIKSPKRSSSSSHRGSAGGILEKWD